MQARYKMFWSDRSSWEVMFQHAAEFMTTIGPEQTIGVSQSRDGLEGVVTVWYWSDQPPPKSDPRVFVRD